MKAALVLIVGGVLLAVAVAGIDSLSDQTQTRPDEVDPSRASVIVFRIHTQAYDGSTAEAAAAQWHVCAGTIGGDIDDRGLEQVDAERFRVTVVPAVGMYGQRRLVGCLNDAAVDRISSRFVSIDDVAA